MWIILVIVKQHLVQIGRIDGPTEYEEARLIEEWLVHELEVARLSSLLLSSLEWSDT